MKTNNTRWLDPVLDLVRKYAPNTYEAMLNADWTVNVVTGSDDLIPISRQLAPGETLQLASALDRALGCTIGVTNASPTQVYDGPAVLNHTTWMNHHAIMQRRKMGFDPLKLAATVLVHEWMHRRGYGEPEAYAAGAKFARRMGEEGIAQEQERTFEIVEESEKLEKLFGAGVR